MSFLSRLFGRGGNANAVTSPVTARDATVASDSLSDRVRNTRALPPAWKTRGPEGSMTQLDGDIRHWIGYLGIGYSWNRYAVQFSAVAQRIKIQYPQWVAYAAYQVVMENGGGADNYADALVYFKRNHGDIDQLTTSAIKTFLVDWGVAPFTDYGV